MVDRNRNGHRWRQLRARVLRNQDVCKWCGEWVDKALPPLDPMAPQVDHILAVAKGGAEYEYHNLQLLHRRCNREKWHREIPTNERLGASRDWWTA